MTTIRQMSDWPVKADVGGPGYRRRLCASCGAQCAASADADLETLGCISCLAALDGTGVAPVLRGVATWWDKASVPGPGYGAVDCPACGVECVVPVGAPLAETGCVGCLRALGPAPLVRRDLALNGRPEPDRGTPTHALDVIQFVPQAVHGV